MANKIIYASGGDGSLGYNSDPTPNTWATARNASSALQIDTSQLFANSRNQADTLRLIGRIFIPFDTSFFSPADTITAATLYVYGKAGTLNPDTESLVLTQSTQASISTLDVSDYSKITLNSPTEGANRFTLASWNTGAYNAFALNASGLTWINKGTGATAKFCLRMARDVDNSEPPTGHNNEVYGLSTATAGTTQDPYLDITYTPGPSGALFHML